MSNSSNNINIQNKYLAEAVKAHYAGNTEKAIIAAKRASAIGSNTEIEGSAVLAEIYYRSAQIDALNEHLKKSIAFKKDLRWKLMMARFYRIDNQQGKAIDLLNELMKSNSPDYLYRMAGFELVKILDNQAEYDAAWKLAEQIHQKTTKPYPIDLLVQALKVTANVSSAELLKIKRSITPSSKTCFIHGLPRSGTTLLEQMLDRHSAIHGCGEVNLIGKIGDQMATEGGGWPIAVLHLKDAFIEKMKYDYQHTVRGLKRVDEKQWTIDKTVFPNLQPLVVSVLFPDAKVILIRRNCKDNAVSLFLNNFAPSWGFTGSMDNLRQFIEADQLYSALIYQRLGVDVLEIQYENLVNYPALTIQKILDFMDLPMESVCLQPEENQRIVYTLSHEQVRKSINREGIERWKNYASYFDDNWDNLTSVF